MKSLFLVFFLMVSGVISAQVRSPMPFDDREMIVVQGPFPATNAVVITDVYTFGDKTFISLQAKQNGQFHMNNDEQYVIRSNQRIFKLLSINGRKETVKVAQGTIVKLAFESFPTDQTFDLLEGGVAKINNTIRYWHITNINLTNNPRKTRILSGGKVNLNPVTQYLRLVSFQETSEGSIALGLKFSAGTLWGNGSERISYYVKQDGKTYPLLVASGEGMQEVTNREHPEYGKVKYFFTGPSATLLFPAFDLKRSFDLIEGSEGKEWNFYNINLTTASLAYPAYADSARTAYRNAQTKNDFDRWIAEFSLNAPDNLSKLAPAKRQEAFSREILASGLNTRFGYRQGRIGERWVPSVSYSTSSSDTVYVNGQAVTTTNYGKDTISGYQEKVEGYTAVYGLKNSSNNAYIVELVTSGTSTYNPTVVQNSTWSDESRARTTNKSAIRVVKRVLVKPMGDFKDQLVVGEEPPNDFKIEVNDFWQVDSAWINRFEHAIGDNLVQSAKVRALQPLLAELTKDSRIYQDTGWKKIIDERQKKIAEIIHDADLRDIKRDVEITVQTKPDYDPDFFNVITVHLRNKSNYRYELKIKKPDNEIVTVNIEPLDTSILDAKVQHIKRNDLRAELIDAVAPPNRSFKDVPEIELNKAAAKKPTRVPNAPVLPNDKTKRKKAI